jgi:hypothetical protein
MAGKSRTPEERAAMVLRCTKIARKYRDYDGPKVAGEDLTDEEVKAMVSRILEGRVPDSSKPAPESTEQAPEPPTKAELRAAEKARERHKERFGR